MPDVSPYRLSIAPDLEAFRREIEYASAFLDRCHFVTRTQRAARVLHYGPDAPPGAVAVPAALFPGGLSVARDGLHPGRERLERMLRSDGSTALFPQDKDTVAGQRLGYDALGLIFLMLSRLEERDGPESDRYGRFRHEAALATRLGRHANPLADQAVFDLARALTGKERPANRTAYEVVMTHDADRLRGYHRWHEPLRNAPGDMIKRRRLAAGLRRLTRAYLGGEPWRSVRALMSLSEEAGLQGRFYFMGPTRRKMDSPYARTMAGLLRRVAGEIVARGHRVGFHPGFGTHADAAEWRRQKAGLEEVIGRPVEEGRQHVLGYAAETTPDIWDDAGMRLDLTLAFPEATGFRSGTCRRFPAYSLCRRRALQLEQVATAIVDFGLFGGKYRDLTVEAALADVAPAVEACRRYGGTLVLLYHTGHTDSKVQRFFTTLLREVA